MHTTRKVAALGQSIVLFSPSNSRDLSAAIQVMENHFWIEDIAEPCRGYRNTAQIFHPPPGLALIGFSMPHVSDG
jgi:hypothetical protein